jgi:hypothetical protein
MKKGHGLSQETPIRLQSIADSHRYMDALLCENGFNILFHRLGSSSSSFGKPMDCYEVISVHGKRATIYVFCYAEKSEWVAPEGFKFDPLMLRGISADRNSLFLEELNDDLCQSGLAPYIHINLGSFGKCSNFPGSLIEQAIAKQQIEDISGSNALTRFVSSLGNVT